MYKVDKIIKKALKNVNKKYYKSKKFLGRYVIRDCFNQIQETKEKGLLPFYCFECVDKATLCKKFYTFSFNSLKEEITVDNVTKKLLSFLSSFITEKTITNSKEGLKQKNFRYIKLD